jgi:hypothetical protein
MVIQYLNELIDRFNNHNSIRTINVWINLIHVRQG